jgi:tetratricopeptide (TPR) repeat protein
MRGMEVAAALSTGLAHHQAGRLQEAEQIYRQILAVAPACADAWHLLGMISRRAGNQDLAIRYVQRAIELNPRFAEAHYNLGNIFQDARRLDEAIACFRRAVEIAPDLAVAHNGLGNVYRDKGNTGEAAECYRRALEFTPDYAEARSNLGVTFYDLGQLDEAVRHYFQALALRPDDASVLYNLGRAFQEQGKRTAAIEHYRSALAVRPELAEAHVGLATALLLGGEFEPGWREYEWRWKVGQLPRRDFGRPLWNGEPLSGKTILLHAEQGFGDTFQFIRYAPLVQALGATVLMEVQRPLVKLLANCLGTDRQLGVGDALPAFDVQVPLLSLPGILKTNLETIPRTVPYLFADAALVEQWRQTLERVPGFRIGINWHGRAGKGSFRNRNIPCDCLASLAELPGVRLISLQQGEGRQELASMSDRSSIIDLGDDVDKTNAAFMDTAAIMMNLDLVITSDTSIPHLAGALGVPVWLALPFAPEWRWLLDRDDSPWYPTMRLFRQATPGDWSSVVQAMSQALRHRLALSTQY